MCVELSEHRLFDEGVLRSWLPLPRRKPSEWASANVVLPIDSPIPGPLNHANAPYLAGMIDLCDARGVSQVNIQKAAQIGVSAAMRWLLGYWAMHDPAPVGLTLPDKEKGREIVSTDLIPFFRDTEALRSLMTRKSTDESGQRLRLLNGFRLHLMWAGSASSTASHPLKRVVLDEVDKMGAWGKGGGEGHAVHRTRKRLRVYRGRSIQINVSTPATAHHMIHRLVTSSSVQLRYLVECPHCRERIQFVWSQVKWQHYPPAERGTHDQWADRVLAESSAWYECQACNEKITEQERRAAIQSGLWGSCDDHGIADGRITDASSVDVWPSGTSIGIQISALYATWESLAKLVHEYLRAIGKLEAMFTFRTETLGEAFEEQRSRVDTSEIRERQREAQRPAGMIPSWTASLIATVDTQRDHFWWLIRAWGPGMRSARVAHGRAETFEELERILMHTSWPCEDQRFPARGCDLILIDSGGTREGGSEISRTMEVYGWVLKHEDDRLRAIKGSNKPMPGIYTKRTRGWYDAGGEGRQRLEVPLWMLDVHHYQDALSNLMRRSVTQRTESGDQIQESCWQLNDFDDPEYADHMAAMVKVADRQGTQIVERWAPISSNARHDLRDCEGYQVAGAYMMHTHMLPPMEEWQSQIEALIVRPPEDSASGNQMNGGWTRPGGRSWFD